MRVMINYINDFNLGTDLPRGRGLLGNGDGDPENRRILTREELILVPSSSESYIPPHLWRHARATYCEKPKRGPCNASIGFSFALLCFPCRPQAVIAEIVWRFRSGPDVPASPESRASFSLFTHYYFAMSRIHARSLCVCIMFSPSAARDRRELGAALAA